MKIGYVSQDWSKHNGNTIPNGCTWYRCILPAKELQKFQHQTSVGTLLINSQKHICINDYVNFGSCGFDVIVFKLAMHESTLAAVRMAKGNGQLLVVDIDDWFDCLPPTNRARLTTDPKLNPQNNTDIYFEIIDNVDAIICSTPALHDFYKQKYPHKMVFMIRNAIDIQRWTPKQQPVSTPVIGWVGATPWRAFDLEELSGFMDRFLQSNNTTFHHAGAVKGAKSAHSLLQVDTKRFSFEFMQPITNLPYLYRNIDIGVVPLQDIPFNQAKSYLKGLEYVAAGIPFVASATEEYKYLASKGIGRVANSDGEWEHHLQQLMNYEVRKQEAHKNRLALLKSFTMENMSVAWNDAFSRIIKKTI